MKLHYRIRDTELYLMLVVLLAYPAAAVARVKNQQAQDDKAQSEKRKEQSKPDKGAVATLFRVKLNVTVFDSSNRPVADVNPEDFQVFESGDKQTIISVTQQDGPLSFGLVLDCSGSMRSQVEDVIKAGEAIIANMKPEDEAFVMRFVSTDKITVIQDWTSNRAKLNLALADIYPEGGQSAIIDAVYAATQHVEVQKKRETTPRRHALILVTDGTDRLNNYNLEQLLKLLRASELQIFVIGLTEEIEGKELKEKAVNFLHTIANVTGGRAFFWDGKLEPNESGSVSEPLDHAVLSRRVLELRQITAAIAMERDAQYLIEYDSTHRALDGSFRKVRVTIKEKQGRDRRIALSRSGYVMARK